MNRFFQNLLGMKSNQVPCTRKQHCQDTVKPQIEALEGRMLLAAWISPMAIAAPVVQVQPATALRSALVGTTAPRFAGPVQTTMVKVDAAAAEEGGDDFQCGLLAHSAQHLYNIRDKFLKDGDIPQADLYDRWAEAVIDDAVDQGCIVIVTQE
jgi:hypothetical protein